MKGGRLGGGAEEMEENWAVENSTSCCPVFVSQAVIPGRRSSLVFTPSLPKCRKGSTSVEKKTSEGLKVCIIDVRCHFM